MRNNDNPFWAKIWPLFSGLHTICLCISYLPARSKHRFLAIEGLVYAGECSLEIYLSALIILLVLRRYTKQGRKKKSSVVKTQRTKPEVWKQVEPYWTDWHGWLGQPEGTWTLSSSRTFFFPLAWKLLVSDADSWPSFSSPSFWRNAQTDIFLLSISRGLIFVWAFRTI